jgi:hemerythrin
MRHYSQPEFHDVVRLDFEHAEQQRLLREYRAAILAGEDGAARLERLMEYNRSHFQLEEMLMEEHAYADFEAHAADHAQLLAATAAMADVAAADACANLLKRHNGERDARLVRFIDQRTTRR